MQIRSQRKSDKKPRSLRIRKRSTIRSTTKQMQQRQKETTPSAKVIELPVVEVVDEAPLPIVKKLDKCKACNNLDPRGHADTRTVCINGNKIHTLRLGPGFPAKDCGYCDLLSRAVMEFYPFSNDLKYERTWKNPTAAILLAEHHPISLRVPVRVDGPGHHCGWLDINALRDIPVMPSIGKASSIFESTDSRSCFDFIQKCLSGCREHVGCKTSYSSTQPRRLLYLEGPSNSFDLQSHQNLKIRLCKTNGQSHRYAALSHCWGSTQIIATKRTNIKKFEEKIDWCLLPKTFQDAIFTALGLEIYYLWIDSLCIIQDDKIDWDTEAAIMGAIYENSYLTIAATSSPSSAAPFLRQRRSPNYRPKTLQFPNPERLSITINNDIVYGSSDDIKALRVRQGPPIYNVGLSQLFNPRIYGPLTTRGWALQERVLSGRIVHFTEEGIVWECRTSIQREDQSQLFPGHLQKWNSFRDITDKEMLRSELQSFWRELLMDYTKRKLTERKDILPALSGIVARMYSFHNSRYLAGLWYDRFIEDLCWRPQTTGEFGVFTPSSSDSVLYKDVDLPSWSWISIRRAIYFAVIDEPGTFTPYSKVVSCNCILAGTNPFGRVRSGCAVVEGPLFEASLSYTGVKATFTNPGVSKLHIELQAPLLEHPLAQMNNGRLVNTVRRAREGEEIKSLQCTVWCLYLGNFHPEKLDVDHWRLS